MKISAVIIAGNEEKKIGDALKSVKWADEILIIDSESSDRTREIAEMEGCRVICRPWSGFSAQKQFGTDAAVNDWIFSLDADERVTPALEAEIGSIASSESPKVAGFTIPRLSYYMDRPIRHSGWYPDRQLRLFDRRRGAWSSDIIHESFKVDQGEMIGDLRSNILHFSVDDLGEHHRMIGERYAPLAAEQMFQRGRTSSPVKAMIAGSAAFFSSYIIKLGFLDGFPGYCISKFAAHNAFLKHAMLIEKQSRDREGR